MQSKRHCLREGMSAGSSEGWCRDPQAHQACSLGSFTTKVFYSSAVVLCQHSYTVSLPYSTALKCRSVPAQLSRRPRIYVSCCSPRRRCTCLSDATPTWNPSSLAVLSLRAESGPIHGQILLLSSLSTHTDFLEMLLGTYQK